MSSTNRNGVTTLNVSLSPELARYVRAKVENGLYASAAEVVREALRLLLLREEAGRDPFDRPRVREAIAGLQELSQQQTLGSELTVRDLIDEGRR